MITSGATTLSKNAVKASILDAVTHFVVGNANGEYFRKTPASIETINTYKKKYTLYLTENEANTVITAVSLIVQGTNTFGTGTVIASQVWNWDKTTGLQSGYYYYTLEVV